MDEMVGTAVTINQQEKLNFEIFKQNAREQNIDISKVRGTGLTREFVPEYMKGDICDRPDRNSRPNSWHDDDGFTDDGIIIDPTIKPKNPLGDSGGLNLGDKSTIDDSSSYSSETVSNIDSDNNDGSIFAKIFGFLDFGVDSGICDAGTFDSAISSTQLLPAEAEKSRDESKKGLLGWIFDGVGGSPLCNPDPSHPSNNPPLFLGEYIPPSD
jgi:hypothetical protein